LGEELGIEPGTELKAMGEAILLQKPELNWHPPARGVAVEARDDSALPILDGTADKSPPTVHPRSRRKRSESIPLPGGLVTFLFTDVESSTKLFGQVGDVWKTVIQRHFAILRDAAFGRNGIEIKTLGDAIFVAFADANDALAAAEAAQRALQSEPWPSDVPLRVRMGIHTGEAWPDGDDYIALAVHQAARIVRVARGGEVLLSSPTAEAASMSEPVAGVRLVDLGSQLLRDFETRSVSTGWWVRASKTTSHQSTPCSTDARTSRSWPPAGNRSAFREK
jgi:class 3 adenylate cyclase